uniref:Uncharacterized protein n=1 Tax=Knipowitschia caucasica TaxID=637954 RepID=A0AAV2JI54_KNICA
MLVQDLMPFTLSFWPFFFGHCLLSLLLLSCQGELQRSCSQTVAEKVSDQCHLACQCRRYPPLPPPPPPPPPPRLLAPSVVEPMEPLVRPWWSEMDFIVLGTVGCASLLFLLSAIIICYKAIKRKPLRKEENGTSRGEYAMSIRNKKAMGTNNTVKTTTFSIKGAVAGGGRNQVNESRMVEYVRGPSRLLVAACGADSLVGR